MGANGGHMAQSKILVVEDEPSVAMLLQTTFEARGWTVEIAGDGEAGLAMLKHATPDLALVDKNLPGMSGVDLVRQIRKENEELGIIMMTGFASADSAQETLNLGVDEYLEKPFSDIFFVAGLVERVLARVRQRWVPASKVKPLPALSLLVASQELARREQIVALLPKTDQVRTAGDAEQIGASLAAEPADVLILDGMSYRSEVTQLVATLKERSPRVACVVLSKRLSLSDIQRLITLEVRGLVDNPLESPAFAGALATFLARARRRKQRSLPT